MSFQVQEDLLQLKEKLLAGNDESNLDISSLEQAIAKTQQGLQVSNNSSPFYNHAYLKKFNLL